MAYQSKDEKKISIKDPSGKWSDMTLLPEWSEKYYDVFTARKHGKWVMLKTLKKEYASDEKMRRMLEHEFDTRYRLAHPNIVMVNDFENIPDIGEAIITDDVYGYSLRRLIDEKRLTPKILHRLQTQLIDALEYIQENRLVHHPLTPDRIIFTEYDENLKLIDVGYDQSSELSEQSTDEDIKSYGRILNEVLDRLPTRLPRLRKIAEKCENGGFHSVEDVHLALERRSSSQIYVFIILFIAFMAGILIWLVASK